MTLEQTERTYFITMNRKLKTKVASLQWLEFL
jgi:hypothetical protein